MKIALVYTLVILLGATLMSGQSKLFKPPDFTQSQSPGIEINSPDLSSGISFVRFTSEDAREETGEIVGLDPCSTLDKTADLVEVADLIDFYGVQLGGKRNLKLMSAWDVTHWNNRLYISHGNRNGGNSEIIYYDLSTQQILSEFIPVNQFENQIIFKETDGILYNTNDDGPPGYSSLLTQGGCIGNIP